MLFPKLSPIFLYLICVMIWGILIVELFGLNLDIGDQDERLTFRKLIASRGFVLQEHFVSTIDGYILNVHRVVPRDYDPVDYSFFRKPVILFHGILTDSAMVYINSPFLRSNRSKCGDNFGFGLLLTGRYDLWVPNARGNGQSMQHVRYSSKDPRFWAFSWEEIALYDIPAFVDYIRRFTGHKTLGYVGYSQGAGAMFALMSVRPEYSRIIQPFISWAPGVYLERSKSPVAPMLRLVNKALSVVPGEFLSSQAWNNFLSQYMICRRPLGSEFCAWLNFQLIFGLSDHINSTRIPFYMRYFPRSTSNFQIAHYEQMHISGRFARYDFGHIGNLVQYGQLTPPDWPLRRIPPSSNLQMLIMYGATDWIIDQQDARKLVRLLESYGHSVVGYKVPSETWSHTDFLIGMNAGELVYDETIKYLDLYAWD